MGGSRLVSSLPDWQIVWKCILRVHTISDMHACMKSVCVCACMFHGAKKRSYCTSDWLRGQLIRLSLLELSQGIKEKSET